MSSFDRTYCGALGRRRSLLAFCGLLALRAAFGRPARAIVLSVVVGDRGRLVKGRRSRGRPRVADRPLTRRNLGLSPVTIQTASRPAAGSVARCLHLAERYRFHGTSAIKQPEKGPSGEPAHRRYVVGAIASGALSAAYLRTHLWCQCVYYDLAAGPPRRWVSRSVDCHPAQPRQLLSQIDLFRLSSVTFSRRSWASVRE